MWSQRLNSEGEVRPSLRDDVALLPEQAQQQVLGVDGPAVDPGVLEPGRDVFLREERQQNMSPDQGACHSHNFPLSQLYRLFHFFYQ